MKKPPTIDPALLAGVHDHIASEVAGDDESEAELKRDPNYGFIARANDLSKRFCLSVVRALLAEPPASFQVPGPGLPAPADLYYPNDSLQAIRQELAELQVENAELREALTMLADDRRYNGEMLFLGDLAGDYEPAWKFAASALGEQTTDTLAEDE